MIMEVEVKPITTLADKLTKCQELRLELRDICLINQKSQQLYTFLKEINPAILILAETRAIENVTISHIHRIQEKISLWYGINQSHTN